MKEDQTGGAAPGINADAPRLVDRRAIGNPTESARPRNTAETSRVPWTTKRLGLPPAVAVVVAVMLVAAPIVWVATRGEGGRTGPAHTFLDACRRELESISGDTGTPIGQDEAVRDACRANAPTGRDLDASITFLDHCREVLRVALRVEELPPEIDERVRAGCERALPPGRGLDDPYDGSRMTAPEAQGDP